MMQYTLEQRRQRYFRLGSQIAQMDDVRLRGLIGAGESQGGWGRHQTIEVAGMPVFVKRVPVTELEYANPLSTRNLFDLPTYYNFGVGSAGLGVFRELVAHIKTTGWVLEGQIETFPLMYQSRIVPFTGERMEVNLERHEGYVRYWAGNENIGRYLLERAEARHELVIFLEHIPHVLHTWLQDHPGRVDAVLDQLFATVDFLRKNGIIHFDAHFHNILIDGARPYLTDFGLVLDRDFALSAEEAAFFRAHTHYDYGEILSGLNALLYQRYTALPEDERLRFAERYGLHESLSFFAKMLLLLDRVEQIHADGLLKLDRRLLAALVRYRPIITLMQRFYQSMTGSDRKDTRFPHARLKRLLKEAARIGKH